MPEDISVRPMAISDLPSVHAVQCAGYAEIFHEPVSIFHQILSDYDAASFVALDDNKIIAYLLAQPSDEYRDDFATGAWEIRGDEEHIYLHDLCIHPDYHGKKIAGKLFKTFLERLETLNFQSIVGISVQQSAVFWAKMGFTMISPYNYNGEPAHYMKREL